MKPIKFGESNATYAENQPEYLPLPVHKSPEPEGEVISCWELSDDEIKELLKTKKVWLRMWTFNQPLQPVCLQVEYPFDFERHKNPESLEKVVLDNAIALWAAIFNPAVGEIVEHSYKGLWESIDVFNLLGTAEVHRQRAYIAIQEGDKNRARRQIIHALNNLAMAWENLERPKGSAGDPKHCSHCMKGGQQFHLTHPCEVCGRIGGKEDANL